jgi:hypothetical protein
MKASPTARPRFFIARLLDRIKRLRKIKSDYALAKYLGVSHSRISTYRTNRSCGEVPIWKMIEKELDLPHGTVGTAAMSERAKTPELKKMWREISLTLKAQRKAVAS